MVGRRQVKGMIKNGYGVLFSHKWVKKSCLGNEVFFFL